MDGWNTSFLLGWSIFRCYVSFRECNYISKKLKNPLTFWDFPTTKICRFTSSLSFRGASQMIPEARSSTLLSRFFFKPGFTPWPLSPVISRVTTPFVGVIIPSVIYSFIRPFIELIARVPSCSRVITCSKGNTFPDNSNSKFAPAKMDGQRETILSGFFGFRGRTWFLG